MTSPSTENDLAAAVLDALLRENFAGFSDHLEFSGPDPVLALPGLPAFPLQTDGFLADLQLRRPAPMVTLDDVDTALRTLADPADKPGIEAFAQECRDALATHQLRDQELDRVTRTLARRPVAAWRGLTGQLGYDALAAVRPHPAYPTAAARTGFSEFDALAHAPEYQPEFALAWVAIPRPAVTRGGPPPPVGDRPGVARDRSRTALGRPAR